MANSEGKLREIRCTDTTLISFNLMKHLSTAHASTILVANNTVVDTVDYDSRPGVANVSSVNKEGHRAVQAAKAGYFCSSFTKTCDTD